MASVSVQIRARSDALPRTRSLTRIIRARRMIMPVGRVDRAGLLGTFQAKRSIASWRNLSGIWAFSRF